MDFTDRYRIPASPDAVWAALHDPSVLASAIPGCESVEQLDETRYRIRAAVEIGPVKGSFDAQVRLDPAAPPPGFTHALIMKGESQGGAAGSVAGEAEIRLAADDGATILGYVVKAALGGRLAQVERSRIDGVTKTQTDEFFANLGAQLRAAAMPRAQAPSPPLPPAAAKAGTIRPKGGDEEGLAPQIWIAGLIVIVIILLIFFGIVL